MNRTTHYHTMIRPDARYRFIEGSLYPLYGGVIAIYSVGRDLFGVYPEPAVRLLTSCKEYKRLDEHARDYLRVRRSRKLSQPARSPLQRLHRYLIAKMTSSGGVLPLNENEVQAVRGRLEEFVKAGLLVPEEQLHQSVKETLSGFEPASHAPEKIAILGIPTRNRDGKLLECLESYLKNFQQYERTCRVHIVDDSAEQKEPVLRTGAIEELCNRYDAGFMRADRRDRLTFAGRIASLAGIPEAVAEFALLGDPRCGNRTGSARNTLLLMAAGESSVQVDDDVMCRIIPSPWMQDGIGLVSDKDCCRYRFDNHHNRTPVEQPVEHVDFLALHEAMLGRHPADLLRGRNDLNLDRLADTYLEKLHRPGTRIAATFAGVYGDSGMFRHWQRLCLEGGSFRALIDEETTYREHLCTRQLLRVAERTTIGDSPFCMAGVAGLDSTRLLPPFMPVQRNQDGVFGQLLKMNFNQALRGYSPWAVLHEPPARSGRVDVSHALSVGPLRTNDILPAMLWSLSPWLFGVDPVQNLKLTGRYLVELAGRSPGHFQASIRESCWQMIRRQMTYLQKCLDERVDAPEYWRKDVQIVLTNFHKLITREDAAIPSDLPGSPPERLALFQQLTEKFGQLLIHWPAMWEAAAEISSRQEHLFDKTAGDKHKSLEPCPQRKEKVKMSQNGYRETAILTTVWKRRHLTRFHFENIAALDRPVFVGVSERWAAELCEAFGFQYVMVENQPLGRKKNRTLRAALSHNWTHVMELGSDDLVDREAFYEYETFDLDHYGLNSIYFAHPETRRAMQYTYHHKFPSVFGAGRVLSRKAVEMATPLWDDQANKRLDILSTEQLNRSGFRAVEVPFDPFIVDIKTGLNLWRYDHYKGTPVDYDALLEKFGLDAKTLDSKFFGERKHVDSKREPNET